MIKLDRSIICSLLLIWFTLLHIHSSMSDCTALVTQANTHYTVRPLQSGSRIVHPHLNPFLWSTQGSFKTQITISEPHFHFWGKTCTHTWKFWQCRRWLRLLHKLLHPNNAPELEDNENGSRRQPKRLGDSHKKSYENTQNYGNHIFADAEGDGGGFPHLSLGLMLVISSATKLNDASLIVPMLGIIEQP